MSESTVIGLSDDHVHSTTGSADAPVTISALCERAIARGLCSICLTEHLDFDRNLPEYGYYVYENALRAVEQAREQYGDRLEIRMGLEVDFEPRFLPEMPAVLAQHPVDFLLGSVHVYRGKHFAHVEPAARIQTADALAALYRDYFSNTRALIRSGLFDCLAHLDYPAKVGYRTVDGTPIPGYAEELDETMTLAATMGIGIEINTKRSRTGAPLAATEAAILRYVEQGGRKITLGSDAHNCDQLSDGLEMGVAVLQRAGFDYQTIFRNRRAEQHPLARVTLCH